MFGDMFGDMGVPAYLSDGPVAGSPDIQQAPVPLPRASNPPRLRLVPNEEDIIRGQAAQMAAAIYEARAREDEQLALSGPAQFHGMSATAMRWGRFGVIDNGVLLLSTLVGFSLDDMIAKKVGVKGYGPVVGALAGNALSDGIAALPEGGKAAIAVTVGALLPLAPVLIAMKYKKPLKGRTAMVVGAASLVLLVFAFRNARRGV
jgi:hypothetical protein